MLLDMHERQVGAAMTAQLPLLAATDVEVLTGEGSTSTNGPARGTAEHPAVPASCVGTDATPAPQPSVIGLDLSLTGTGMSDGETTWLIRSTGKKADDLPTRTGRLRKIRAEVITRCEGAEMVVVEGPTYMTSTGHMHDRSGLWWLVVMALQHRGISVAEVSPPTLKKYATGRGNAKKGEIVEAATRRLPHVQTGGDDNRADALWLHAMGLDHLTGLNVVPEAHRVALTAVRWPALRGDS